MSSCQPQSLEKGKVKALDPDRMLRKRKLDYDYSTCNTSENRDGGCNSSQLQSSHPSGESNSVSDRKAQDPDNSKCSIGFDGLVSNVSDPDVMIKLLLSNLRKEEERLRKLNMVKKYREKNNLEELGELIDKWRAVCQQSFQDLVDLLPPPHPSWKELLDHLQIDYGLVHFDVENESFL